MTNFNLKNFEAVSELLGIYNFLDILLVLVFESVYLYLEDVFPICGQTLAFWGGG